LLSAAATANYVATASKQALDAAKAGDMGRLAQLLASPNAKLLTLSLRDQASGNTLLHYGPDEPGGTGDRLYPR